MAPHQIEYMPSFKQGELYVAKGAHMLSPGTVSPHLHTVSRRNARERIGYLAVFLLLRGCATGMAGRTYLNIPLNQSLRRSKVIEWARERIGIHHLEAALACAKYDLPAESPRPFM